MSSTSGLLVKRLQRAGTLLLLAGTLGACTTIDRQEAADTGKLLAAAGFQKRPARSTERQQELSSMPPHRMVAHADGAKAVYTYADPQNCRCFYVGGPKEYAQYRDLEASEQIARHMNATWMNPPSMDWGGEPLSYGGPLDAEGPWSFRGPWDPR